MPSGTIRSPERHAFLSSGSRRIMHRIAALAVMTVCEAREPEHHCRQRSTTDRIVKRSKGNPKSSARCARSTAEPSPGCVAVRGVPDASPFRRHLLRGCRLAHQQAFPLVLPEEAAELGILVARKALDGAREVPPEHRRAAIQHRALRQAVYGAGKKVERRGPHEVLTQPRTHASSPDACLAGTHRAKVQEAKVLVVHGLGNPAEHARAMAIDAVPHHLPDETTDLAEAADPVELRRAQRDLVSAGLWHKRASPGIDEPGLARAGAESRLALHAENQQLEVPPGQIQIHVKLADVVEFVEVHSIQTLVEGLDHAGTHAALASIGAADHAKKGQLARVFLEDLRGIVGGPVVDDDPRRGRNCLRCHAVQGAAHEFRLVPTRRYEKISALRAHRWDFRSAPFDVDLLPGMALRANARKSGSSSPCSHRMPTYVATVAGIARIGTGWSKKPTAPMPIAASRQRSSVRKSEFPSSPFRRIHNPATTMATTA